MDNVEHIQYYSNVFFSGVCHADDQLYMWEYGLNFTYEDALVRDMITTTLTNFAKFGDPTPPNSGLSWAPRPNDLVHHFFNISGPEPKMATDENIERRMELWDKILHGDPK